MNIILVIQQLTDLNIRLSAQGERLIVDAPKGAVTPALAAMIKEHKPALLAFLQEQAVTDSSAIQRTERQPGEGLPLSQAQKRLWFIDTLQGQSTEYNMVSGWMVTGEFDTAIAEQALQQLIQRHEVLRTCYLMQDDQPVQVIQTQPAFQLTVMDGRAFTEEQWQQCIADRLASERKLPFDLSQDLMIRARFVVRTESKGVLFLTMHHIASDGQSTDIFAREFMQLYQRLLQGSAAKLPELTIQYADYAAWQQSEKQQAVIKQQLDWWQQQLDEAPGIHDIPLDFNRPARKQTVGATLSSQLTHQHTEALQTLAKQQGMSLFMLLHAALARVVSVHSGSRDIVIGTPVANRTKAELAPLIGFFVNMLVLRTDTSQQNVQDYLQHIRQVNLDAQAHQDVPFEQLVELQQAGGNAQHSPLFQILLALETAQSDQATDKAGEQANEDTISADKALQFRELTQRQVASRFDLELYASESDNGTRLNWVYDPAIFTADHVRQLADHLVQQLTNFVDHTIASPASDANWHLLSQQEIQQLEQWGNPDTVMPDTQGIIDCFNQQVADRPDAIAVVCGETTLSYQALNQRADSLAWHLQTAGASAGEFIGLCQHRSIEMIVSMLAVLKVGAASVLIDPSYPDSRLKHILSDSGVQRVITHSDYAALSPLAQVETCLFADDEALYQHQALVDLSASLVTPEQAPAYITYTSGTTGLPKGTVVPHSGVIRLVKHCNFMTLDHETRFLHASSVAFDAATLEVWGPLLNGGTCILYPEKYFDLALLNDLLYRQQVSAMWLTTSLFNQWSLERVSLPALNTVLCGGEALDPDAISRAVAWYPQIQFINGYGPTENTTFTCCLRIPADFSGDTQVPIGYPVTSTSVRVLADDLTPVPPGAVGELYTSGAGLALEYLNQPELTAQRFVTGLKDGLSDSQNDNCQCWYKTGDLVRYLPDGSLDFVGRADNQIKIRGFRIELAEIEQNLMQCPGVQQCTVQVRTNEQAVSTGSTLTEKRILAWLVADESVLSQTTESAYLQTLKQQLAQKIPEFMMPVGFMLLPEFPVTINGKLDVRRLPDIDLTQGQGNYRAATTDTEQALVSIWSDLLNIEEQQLSIDANFFELGGHSLLITRLIGEVRKQLNKTLTIGDVFHQPSIAQLAAMLSGADETQLPPVTAVERKPLMPLSDSQRRLWIIDKIQGQSDVYNVEWELTLKPGVDEAVFCSALSWMINRHEILRTTYRERDGEGFQAIQANYSLPVTQHDLTTVSDAEAVQQYKAIYQSVCRAHIDMSTELPIKVALVRFSGGLIRAAGVIHHIAIDGWSMKTFEEELVKACDAFAVEQVPVMIEPALQYADYAVWQQQVVAGDVIEQELNWWQQQLQDIQPLHRLPLDKQRPAERRYQGKQYRGLVPPGLSEALKRFAKKHDASPFMVMQTIFSVFIQRFSNENDVIMGIPVAGRDNPEIATMLGCFVNTLVLRNVINPDATLLEQLLHSKTVLADAYRHQTAPFDLLVEKLQVRRSTAFDPLFQLMFNLREMGNAEQRQVTSGWHGDNPEKFDLTLTVFDYQQQLVLEWSADMDLFTEQTIEHWHSSMVQLMDAVLMQPRSHLASIPAGSDAEIEHWLALTSRAEQPFSEQVLLSELIEYQARQSQERIAIQTADGSVTYQALNQQANRLAHHLINQFHINVGDRVAICLPRGIDFIVATLAILKTGAAYVPVDPSYPEGRIAYMLQDAQVALLIGESDAKQTLTDVSCPMFVMGGENTVLELAAWPGTNPEHSSSPDRSQTPAYVIYTSGTTGKPKGVVVEHRSLVNVLEDTVKQLNIDASSVFYQSTGFGFDASPWVIWSTLMAGGQLIVATNKDFVGELNDWPDVTHLMMTPSMLSMVTPRALPALSTVVVGGEACDVELASRWLPYARFINAYGPTEATICCSMTEITNSDDITLGQPIANSAMLVLDEHLQLKPPGANGELYIAGVCLANGYLNQPEQTEQVFIENPWYRVGMPTYWRRLYRTGDLARYRQDGKFEYMGRVDKQVKIRGFRVEPGEVQQRLMHIQTVNQAVVLPVDGQLAAWITLAEQSVSSDVSHMADSQEQQTRIIRELRNELANDLPDYMLPSTITIVPDIPVNANGKLDIEALPEPTTQSFDDAERTQPETPLEHQLCAIWSSFLKTDALSVTSNFFESGGHSLMAIKLCASISTETGIHVRVNDLFSHATVRQLAEFMTSQSDASAQTTMTASSLEMDAEFEI